MGRLKNLAKNSPAAMRSSGLKNVGEVATVGMSFVFSLVIGTAIGWWLDNKFGWKPYGFLGGLGFGLAAGIRSVYVILKPILTRKPPVSSTIPSTTPSSTSETYDDRP